MSDRAADKINDVRDLYRHNGAAALRDAPARAWHPPSSTVPTQAEAAGNPPSGGKRILPYKHFSELAPQLQSEDLVHNLLAHGDVSVVYGQSNVGKSFWALELAAHVASSMPYRGDSRVQGGIVFYVTLEGQRAFSNRIEALRIKEKLNPGAHLYVINSAFALLNDEDCGALVEAVKEKTDEWKIPARLIVIDTLGRAMAGGDENSSVDMTSAIRAVDEIKTKTGAHVMLVHHSGKDTTKGARGHSSLRAAVDTEIEIHIPAGSALTCVEVRKQRGLSIVRPMFFQLETVILNTNNYGEDVTSCVVKHDLNAALAPAGKKWKSNTKEVPSHEQVLSLVPEEGTIHKAQFKDDIQRKLCTGVRDAETLIRDMLSSGQVLATRVKTEAGQHEVHITRRRSK